MKISMINGSPKVGNSCSGVLLDQLAKDVLDQMSSKLSTKDFNRYRINKEPLSNTDIAEIVKSDIIVVAFPLYVDGIPSHMLAALYQLEEAFSSLSLSTKPTFYGIINNGFSESFQNQNAANMLRLFTQRAGITFGQVFAVGAGEMLRSMVEQNVPFGQAALSYVKEDWAAFVGNITSQKSAPTLFCSPKIPSLLFRVIGNRTFWNPSARKNGVTKKQMNRRITYSPK